MKRELVGYEGPHRIYRLEDERGIVYEGMDWGRDRVLFRHRELAEVEVCLRDYRLERE